MKLLWFLGLDIDVPWWLIVIIILLFAYYEYMIWDFNIYKNIGFGGPNPLPVIGNMRLLLKKGWQFNDRKLIDQYGRFFGFFFGRLHSLMVYDISFIKQVLVKEFNSFEDRSGLETTAKPMDRALTNLRGDDWRVVRNTLTPTFSAGKMKKMSKSINECAAQLVENIDECVAKDQSFDFKEMSGAYSMDVIARTAFGLEINSQKDKNNAFVNMAKDTTSGGLFRTPFFIIRFFFPFALKFFEKLGLAPSMPRKPMKFFLDVVDQTFGARKQSKEKRVDFMQLMVDAHKEETKTEDIDEENRKIMEKDRHKKKTLTKDDILANSLLFFIAGYETTANTLTFMTYLLAKNPECQDKLINEIDDVLGVKEPNYEILHEMPYLDQTVNETLRLYPQATRLQRYCKKDVTINGVELKKGMSISIPVYALQTDPDIWPHPFKFEPDRFSPEEKAKRDPYYYLPFGNGPRNCIGMRLALMEMKMVVIRLLQKYKLVPCAETEDPIVIHDFRMKPKNGMMLKAVKR